MIFEVIIQAFMIIPTLILSFLPTLSIEIPDNILSVIYYVFIAVGTFFPIGGLLPIFIVNLSLDLFKIIMAVVVRIKSFIPTMGG
jgi:hypothetical protein